MSIEPLKQGAAKQLVTLLARQFVNKSRIQAYLLSERTHPPYAVRITHLSQDRELYSSLIYYGAVRSRKFSEQPDEYDRKPTDPDDYLAKSRYRSVIFKTRHLDMEEFRALVDTLVSLAVPWDWVEVVEEEDVELNRMHSYVVNLIMLVICGRPELVDGWDAWEKAAIDACKDVRTPGSWWEWFAGERRQLFASKLRERTSQQCPQYSAEQQEYLCSLLLTVLPPPNATFR